MSVAKLKSSNTQVAMKSNEGNDSLDSIIRQAIGKEPFLSFSRAGESPVQWIQLLHALDQPAARNPETVVALLKPLLRPTVNLKKYLPGWPLLSPLKVQMQKCDKCSREFCSPINHRRHIRVDHRPRKLDSSVDRDKLRTFWDELSLDKAKETVSFENATLEEVGGSSIITSLTSLVKKQGFSSLPQSCAKAGSALLGIILGEFHERIPSEKLFSILDDASEKTFLCGKAESVQKYVFDGEAGNLDLEKNVVACTSFLVEKKLIKAWHDHKDLEAMEAQESLLLEEVAAKESGKGMHNTGQSKKTKPQRKLKKKEGKAKAEVKEGPVDMRTNVPAAETASPSDVSSSDSHPQDTQLDPVPVQVSNSDEDAAEAPLGFGCSEPGIKQTPQRQKEQKRLKQKEDRANVEVKESTVDMSKADPSAETPSPLDVSRSDSHPRDPRLNQVPASCEPNEDVVAYAPSGSDGGHAEPGNTQNVERGTSLVTGRRDTVPRRQVPARSQRGVTNVGFLGAQISQAPKLGAVQKHGTHRESRAAPIANVNKVWSPKPKPDFDGESSKIRVQKETANQPEQNKKCEVFIVGSIPVALGPTGIRQEIDLPGSQDNCYQMPKKSHLLPKPTKQDSVPGSTNRSLGKHWRPVSRHETSGPMSVQSGHRDSEVGDNRESEVEAIVGKGDDQTPVDDYHEVDNTLNRLPEGRSEELSSSKAKAFLAHRWKEAIAADHVKLVLSSDSETQDGCQLAASFSSKPENAAGSVKSSSAGPARSKIRKPDKGVATRYVRKQR